MVSSEITLVGREREPTEIAQRCRTWSRCLKFTYWRQWSTKYIGKYQYDCHINLHSPRNSVQCCLCLFQSLFLFVFSFSFLSSLILIRFVTHYSLCLSQWVLLKFGGVGDRQGREDSIEKRERKGVWVMSRCRIEVSAKSKGRGYGGKMGKAGYDTAGSSDKAGQGILAEGKGTRGHQGRAR